MSIYPKRTPGECALIIDANDLTVDGNVKVSAKLHVVRLSVKGNMTATACGKEPDAYYRFPLLRWLMACGPMCPECHMVIETEVVFTE